MDLILNKISGLKEAEERPSQRPAAARRLTKEDIGNPMDFRHEVHIGWDSDFNSMDDRMMASRGRTYSEGAPQRRPAGASSPDPRQPSTNVGGDGRQKRVRRLTKGDIGVPTDFKHKAHIGWDHFYGFRMESCGDPMDSSVNEILRHIGTTMNGGLPETRTPQEKNVTTGNNLDILPPPSPESMPSFNPNCVQIFIDDRPVPPPRFRHSVAMKSSELCALPPADAIPMELPPHRPHSDRSFFDSTNTRL